MPSPAVICATGVIAGTVANGRTISSFKEKLSSWHTLPDGEHYCSHCWKKYLRQFSKNDRPIVEQNAMPTAEAIGDVISVFCCRCGDQVTK